MKIQFELVHHTNDKGTGFAGSLHAGCVLAAMALAQQRTGQASWPGFLHSNLRFLRPVTSDFSIEAEWRDRESVRCEAVDAAGLKVRSAHVWQSVKNTNRPLMSWADMGARVKELTEIQAVIAQHFPISRRLHITEMALYEKGLLIQRQIAEAEQDLRTQVLLDIVLVYLAAWSFVSAQAQCVGDNDVVVAKSHTWVADHRMMSSHSNQSMLGAANARWTIPEVKPQVLVELEKTGKSRCEVIASSGGVVLQGVFHITLKDTKKK